MRHKDYGNVYGGREQAATNVCANTPIFCFRLLAGLN